MIQFLGLMDLIKSLLFNHIVFQRNPPDSPMFKLNQSNHGNPSSINRITASTILHEYSPQGINTLQFS